MSKLYGGLRELKSGEMSFDEVLTYYTDIPLCVFVRKTGIIKKKEGNDMARIRNQASVDLRNYTPAALKKIKSITNVATIMLPENPSPEFSEAFAGIKKLNVADTICLPDNACIFNGSSVLTKDDVADNSFVICNGLTIVRDMPKEKNLKLIVNGKLIKTASAFIDIVKVNGSTSTVDTDAKLIYSIDKLTIDKNFINNLSDKTAIVACGIIFIDNEVTEEMLKTKDVAFYCIGQIAAKKELHGYIRANSQEIAKIFTHEEAEKVNRKMKKRFFRWK